jgi:hypothetical protein
VIVGSVIGMRELCNNVLGLNGNVLFGLGPFGEAWSNGNMFDERNREEVEYGTHSSFLNSRDMNVTLRHSCSLYLEWR